jgi:hypothetical protein
MNIHKVSIVVVLVLLLNNVSLFASDKSEFDSFNPSASISTLKVFFEGQNIDFDYIRRNINFVDFVNDPKGSDVHIIVTKNRTGSGGTNYILNFYSQNLNQIGNISLNCISSPGDTDDAVRECITRALKLGLMPYVNETSNGDMIDILYTQPEQQAMQTVTNTDQWKQWVFRLDANGGFNVEESKTNYNYSFNVRADKITENIKFRASYWMRNKFEEIDNEGDLITSQNNNKFARIQTVYSLTDRWSTGVFLSFFQSTYWNTLSSYDIKPAIEYNFFPWEDADKRVFTASYSTGIEMKNYYETTIFGKEKENLWAHNLELNFELIQPWGEIETKLEGRPYWHDLTKNRVSFESDLSFRITRGLSLNFGFRAENVHNQLYLPAGELSLEDILLGNQKLPSTFEISGGMGVRIQFGSLFNNVVNNRL